ncbi:Arabinose operon regulatory protein [compost metagenome]
MIEYLAGSTSLRDLHINQYGIEQCAPLHHHGPAVRDHYLIHFILEGCGRFEADGRTYLLGKGEAFLIYPGTVTYYEADQQSPWHYCWVGFQGVQAGHFLHQAGLSVNSPILSRIDPSVAHRYIAQMHDSKGLAYGRELLLNSLLYALFAHMIELNPHQELKDSRTDRRDFYVQKVLDFVGINYANQISIAQIAAFVGLDRSYLCSIFKERTHSSLQQYLIQYRIGKACELMNNRLLSIGDIARSVGYEDPLLFSKIFKKAKGLSPKHYRQAQISKEEEHNN